MGGGGFVYVLYIDNNKNYNVPYYPLSPPPMETSRINFTMNTYYI